MDLKDELRKISDRIPSVRGQLQTEEATKNSLIMPFIRALGYDVFDHEEVVPEFNADVGIKKGEKADYAIMKDGQPIILFECKTIGTDLTKVAPSQLYRYFSVTDAKIGILTDGVHYHIFSDLDKTNKMDDRPFSELSLEETDDELVAQLTLFSKEGFNLDRILSTARDLKYRRGIKRALGEHV